MVEAGAQALKPGGKGSLEPDPQWQSNVFTAVSIQQVCGPGLGGSLPDAV